MNPIETVAILTGLVSVATLLGLAWRAKNGHVRRVVGTNRISPGGITPDGAVSFGSRATLLQFSTGVCAPCRSTHTLLSALANELGKTDDVKHVDIDVTSRPDIASRYNLLQSPTTFILDGDGMLRARIGGRPKRDEVEAELQRILAPARPSQPVSRSFSWTKRNRHGAARP